VVEIWDVTDSPIDMCIGFNHVEAGRAVADYLHGLGHRRAAAITANDERAVRRQIAFAQRFGLLCGTDVPVSNTNGPASIGAGRKALADLVDRQGFETGAIFCSSDLLAQGVLIEAATRGLAVPGDLSVVGFGDQDFAKDLMPALTTVAIDRLRLGQMAANALLMRIEGHPTETAVLDIGFQIVARASA